MNIKAEPEMEEMTELDNIGSLPGVEAGPSTDESKEPSETGWSRRLTLVIFLTLTAVFLISVIYDPGDRDPYGAYSTICVFKNVTTLPCPGCGLSHSFCEIGKGDLASAFAWNWMGIPLFGFGILVWLKSLLLLSGWSQPAQALDRIARRVRPFHLIATALVIYGIGRIIYILFFLRPARANFSLSQAVGWLLA